MSIKDFMFESLSSSTPTTGASVEAISFLQWGKNSKGNASPKNLEDFKRYLKDGSNFNRITVMTLNGHYDISRHKKFMAGINSSLKPVLDLVKHIYKIEDGKVDEKSVRDFINNAEKIFNKAGGSINDLIRKTFTDFDVVVSRSNNPVMPLHDALKNLTNLGHWFSSTDNKSVDVNKALKVIVKVGLDVDDLYDYNDEDMYDAISDTMDLFRYGIDEQKWRKTVHTYLDKTGTLKFFKEIGVEDAIHQYERIVSVVNTIVLIGWYDDKNISDVLGKTYRLIYKDLFSVYEKVK